MSEDIYLRLAEQFPTEAHKTLERAGGQTYVAWNLVAERMNTVLGFQNWSFRIVREGFTDQEAWALGELTVTLDGVVTVRQQYGVSPLAVGSRAAPVDDLMKKVGTDALKKCAQTLGVALYLTDADERREVQNAMREQAKTGGKPAQKPTPLRKPAAPRLERLALIDAYNAASLRAVELGHHQSADLINRKAESLSSEKLAELTAALAAWNDKRQAAG